jgi:hypothetical protein
MSDKTTMRLADLESKNDLAIEFSWKGRKTDDHLKIRVGDSEGTFKKEDLWCLLFTNASEEWQEKMITTTAEEATTFEKLVDVKVLEDVPKGKELRVKVPFSIPNNVLEQLVRERKLDVSKLLETPADSNSGQE